MKSDEKFMTWFDTMSVAPGTVVMSFTMDGSSPFDYHFLPPADASALSCGFRMFVHADNGEVVDVEYFTIYPTVMSMDADGNVSEPSAEDAAKELAAAPPEYWRAGWEACLFQGSHVIGGMQSKYATELAASVGFDIDLYSQMVAAAVGPDPDIIVRMCVARLRAEVVARKAADVTLPVTERMELGFAALSLVEDMCNLAALLLDQDGGESE